MATRTPGGYTDARSFARRLERSRVRCRDCGFEGPIMGGEWETRAGRALRTGHLVYRLTCPDCRGQRTVETTL